MKVRQFASIFALVFFITVQKGFAQSEESILGVWYNTEKTAKVQITQNEKEFMGKIIWLLEPERNGVPAMDD